MFAQFGRCYKIGVQGSGSDRGHEVGTALVKHPLTDAGLTAFVNDWKKTGQTIV